MDKRSMGLYEKFRVERIDGTSELGKKHNGCRYFVLDLDHDPYALPAIKAYADSCMSEYPILSSDLKKVIDGNSEEIFIPIHEPGECKA